MTMTDVDDLSLFGALDLAVEAVVADDDVPPRESTWRGPWLDIPGYTAGPTPKVVAIVCLDGSLWVTRPDGTGSLNVAAKYVTGLTNPPPVHNPHGLTPAQVQVLLAFAAAGREGLADFEHTSSYSQATVAEHRRELITKGLLLKRYGEVRTNETTTGHVWAITHAGEQALKPPPPPSPV